MHASLELGGHRASFHSPFKPGAPKETRAAAGRPEPSLQGRQKASATPPPGGRCPASARRGAPPTLPAGPALVRAPRLQGRKAAETGKRSTIFFKNLLLVVFSYADGIHFSCLLSEYMGTAGKTTDGFFVCF